MIPYFSLAAGFLTGKYRSEADLTKSARGAHVEEIPRPARPAASSPRSTRWRSGTARRRPRSRSAWLVAQPGITAPIASATSLEQFRDLVAGVQLQLDADALRLLSDAGAEAAH